MSRTWVKQADWVVAYDAGSGTHSYLTGADVVFEGNVISFVGKGYDGTADTVIDGKDVMVMPGLVDAHSHPSLEASYRGLREEHALANMHMTGLFERSQAYSPADDEGACASAEVAYCEMLLSGVTSVADLSKAYDGWADLMARSGLRSFLAPWYASARWKLENDWDLKYSWDEPGGREGMDRALKFIDEVNRHPSGRLSGIVFPAQIDTCTPDLLRDSADYAREKGLPVTTHAAQAVSEFQEIVKRYGKTPIQWLQELGFLGPNTTVAHAIFLDTHSWVKWWTKKDLGLLAETGTSVAHCPTPFARYGQILENFGDYRRAGVNMAVGTDTTPHNIIEEIRKAATFARIASHDMHNVQAADIFHAATLGGARALLRDDIGALAPGKKADLVLVDLKNPWMMPARDPLRSLIYHAADRAVRDVYVDGQLVVKDRKILTLNHQEACERLTEAQQRMMAATRQRDYLGRTADEITPVMLPMHAG